MDRKRKILYVTANVGNRTPNSLLAVNLETKTVKKIIEEKSDREKYHFFDGIAFSDGKIYFSDWNNSIHEASFSGVFKNEPVNSRTKNISLQGLTEFNNMEEGPADVIVSMDSIFIYPAFKSGKIIIEKAKQ